MYESFFLVHFYNSFNTETFGSDCFEQKKKQQMSNKRNESVNFWVFRLVFWLLLDKKKLLNKKIDLLCIYTIGCLIKLSPLAVLKISENNRD